MYISLNKINRVLDKKYIETLKLDKKYGRVSPKNKYSVAGVSFKPRKEVFESPNLFFDPNTGYGTSYNWYCICKLFKGEMVLNTFSYSVTTAKHVNQLRSLFRNLGVKYREIEAPQGLGSVDRCKEHSLYVFAETYLKEFHSRGSKLKPVSPSNLRKYFANDFGTLKIMGIKISNPELVEAISKAEDSRRSRLKGMREKRFEKKLETYLETVVCFRDYEIKPRHLFGNYNKIGVHQVVENIEADVSNALENFHKDGFPCIVFYVGGAE